MTRRSKTIVGVAAGVLVLIQVYPIPRKNPPITRDVAAPAPVEAILQRSCYDCHSNATQWPWYAHVAPVSWLVVRDVDRGRNRLNFSTWDKYSDDPETVIRKYRNIDRELESRTMPLWYYLANHPEARLSDADRAALEAWVTKSITVEDKQEQSQP